MLFLRLNNETTGYPDGTRRQPAAADPGHQLREPAAELPHRLGPRRGVLRRAVGSPETLGSDASYLRFYGRRSASGPSRARSTCALRGEFGTSWVNEFSKLPASQRFFAGGDRSVRGFALNELSPPLPEDELPTDHNSETSGGGEHKIVGSLEVERDFPRNFRGAVFFDIGNAFNDWNTPLEYSVGIGVRWKLPMLMIGFDVAQALSEDDLKPRFHLNMTQVL